MGSSRSPSVLLSFERINRLTRRQFPHSNQADHTTTQVASNISRSSVGIRKRSLSNGYFNPEWVRRHQQTRPGGPSSQLRPQRAASPQPQSSNTESASEIIPQQAARLTSFNQFLTQHNLNLTTSTSRTTPQPSNTSVDATITIAIEMLMQNSIAIRRLQLENRLQQTTPNQTTEPTAQTPVQDFTTFVSLVRNNARNSRENVDPILGRRPNSPTISSASDGIHNYLLFLLLDHIII